MAYQSKKTRERKKQRRQKKIVLYFFAFTVLMGSFFILLNQSFVRIQNINIKGNIVLKSTDIKSVLNKDLKKAAWQLIPSDSVFFIQDKKLEQMLLSDFPRIETVKVKTKLFKTLDISLQERNTEYQFCQSGQCFTVDGQGYIFAQRQSNDQDILQLYSEEEKRIGQYYLNGENFTALITFMDGLESRGIKVDSVYIDISGKVFISVGTTQILVTNSQNYDKEFTNIIKLLRQDEFSLDVESGYFKKPVVYLNLRFGNKVFYCFTGDECELNYKRK